MKSNLPAPTAKTINDAHRCAKESAENAVEWAVKCGQLLAAKKKELPHGEFQDWIDSNCEFSYKTAALYMKAAGKSLTALDFSSVRHLFPSGQPGAKSNNPKGAVSVVNPEGGRTTAAKEGTEETGADRPAAPASKPEVTPEQRRVAQQVRDSIKRQQEQTQIEDDAPERPSDEELAAIDREIQESEARVLRSDDVTAGYHAELKRQAAEIAVLKTTRDGYMRGKDSVTKMLQTEQRKVAKLEKENKSLRERIASLEAA